MCPAPLSPKKFQNSPKQRVIPPIKFFSLTTIRILSRICNVRICAKFHKKPNGSEEIPQGRPKNNPKWPPGKEDLI